MEKKTNPHVGHRQRMREKVLKDNNLKAYSDHNILEMLLFYAIPRGDTNELAHRLIDTFGSISAVFDADISQLTQVSGVGESTAVLLKLIPSVMQRYYESKMSCPGRITCINDAVNYFRTKFFGENTESIYLLCMNNDGKILKFSRIGSGNVDFTSADPRSIMQEMLLSKATTAIIAHNHPSGICAPSTADVNATQQISKLMASINTTLIDHIIIAGNDYFSFASNEKFRACFSYESSDVFTGYRNKGKTEAVK